MRAKIILVRNETKKVNVNKDEGDKNDSRLKPSLGMLYKKVALEIFVKLTGKHLWWSPFLLNF